MNASTLSAERGHTLRTFGLLALALILAAIVGAYVDWLWWPDYSGIVLTLVAIALFPLGAVLAVLARGSVRRVGLVILAVGLGLLAGQNLGPSREPLIYTTGGSMTVRLESPVVAVGTGPADCTNVASRTEYQVSGTPIVHLDQLGRVWDSVYLTVGDRWDAIEDGPRKDGVLLSILGTDMKIPDHGGPSMVAMQATGSSTLIASFSNEGGSARFANLEPRIGEGLSAAPMDLAGTIEWTCGEVATTET